MGLGSHANMDMELSRVNVEKPRSGERKNTRHDIDKDMAEDVADEAPAVENSHYLVPAKEWGAETRNVGKGGTDLFMSDEKSTSAKYMDANRANYTELDTGQHQEVVSKMVQVVAIEGDKKGTIMQGEVDDKKSTSGDDSIIQHVAVEHGPDNETFPHPTFSRTAPKFLCIAPEPLEWPGCL